MADAGAGLDAGDGGVFHTGPDEARAAPGNEQVHQTLGLHELTGTVVAGVLQNIENIGVSACGGDALLQSGGDGPGAADGLTTAAQDADIAALNGQGRGIGGDIGTALVDDGHQAQRHLLFIDGHAVRALHFAEDAARVVREPGHGAKSVGHGGDAAFIQPETVQHHIGNFAPGGFHIPGVDGENVICMLPQALSHGQEQAVLILRRQGVQAAPGGPGAADDFHSRHGVTPSFSKILCPRACPGRCRRAGRAYCRWQ